MFKRVRWVSIGAVIGVGGSVYAQVKMRQTAQRYLPPAVGARVAERARLLGQDVHEAIAEGRHAMHEREVELRARMDPVGRRPPRDVHDVASRPGRVAPRRRDAGHACSGGSPGRRRTCGRQAPSGPWTNRRPSALNAPRSDTPAALASHGHASRPVAPHLPSDRPGRAPVTGPVQVPGRPGRLIGLDLGARRVGVAVCDSDRTLATGVTALQRKDPAADHRAVADLVAEYEAVGVVVGLPLSLSGAVGPAAQAAAREVEELRAVLAVPVDTVDERLTTVQASTGLRAGGRRARQQRAVIDREAAAGLLQTWIERHRGRRLMPGRYDDRRPSDWERGGTDQGGSYAHLAGGGRSRVQREALDGYRATRYEEGDHEAGHGGPGQGPDGHGYGERGYDEPGYDDQGYEPGYDEQGYDDSGAASGGYGAHDDGYYDDDGYGPGGRRGHARRRPGRGHPVRMTILGLLLAIVVAIVGFGLHFEREISPGGRPGKVVSVTIPAGASSAQIGILLADAGVIHGSSLFRYYVKLKGAGPLLPGTYQLARNEKYDQVISSLSAGPPLVVERLTIPEGYTLQQIAARVAGLPRLGLSAAKFMQAETSGQVRSPYEPTGVNNLEGLVFPATYDIRQGMTETDILQALVARFDEEATTLNLAAGAAALQMTPYQVITVASIVEREAKLDGDRGPVASALYNRLRQGITLGADSTLVYALRQVDPSVAIASIDYNQPNPYNTRLNKGLPPTPIANAGIPSLTAAVTPPATTYLYFVETSPDGKLSFASTSSGFSQLEVQCRAANLC